MTQEKVNDITSNTKISIEILIVLIVLTGSIVGSFIRAEMNNATNKEAIAELRGEYIASSKVTNDELKALNKTLTEMLIQARIKNERDMFYMGDRWTGSMMQELLDDIYDSVATWSAVLHPEHHPDRSTWPNVEEIQKRGLRRMGLASGYQGAE